jgi:hypothetical protein
MADAEFQNRVSGSTAATVLHLLKRLTAAIHLLRLVEEVVPRLVSVDRISRDKADAVLAQIPELRRDIDRQVNAAKIMMTSVDHRIEPVAEILLTHRESLTQAQQEDLNRWWNQLRG